MKTAKIRSKMAQIRAILFLFTLLLGIPIIIVNANSDTSTGDFEISVANDPPSFIDWYDPVTLLDPMADAPFFVIVYDQDNDSTGLNITLWYTNDSFATVNISVQMNFAISKAINTYKFTYNFPGEPQGTYYQYYYQAYDGYNLRKKPSELGVFLDIQWDVFPVEFPDYPGSPGIPGVGDIVTIKDYTSLFNFMLLLIFVLNKDG